MIVDIVETGTTLKENDLSVFNVIAPSSARLIGKPARATRFHAPLIDEIKAKLEAIV